jgi:hypothetical protein
MHIICMSRPSASRAVGDQPKKETPAVCPDPSADDLRRQDLILSSVLLLMSRYAAASAEGAACPRLAVSIQCHLELLAERARLPRLVRETCGLLAEEWRRSLAEHENIPPRTDLRSLVRRARLR